MYNISLKTKKCIPCEGGAPPIAKEKIQKNLSHLKEGWRVDDDKKIQRIFKFKDFKQAIRFINKVANIAENEGHHPDMRIFYSKVIVELTTHAIKGLSENDFIVAAKIDALYETEEP